MIHKKAIRKVIALILYITPLDFLIFIFSKTLYFFSKLLYLKEWDYNISGMPLFFKHQLDFNIWRFDPTKWSFILRGVHAREKMFQNCKVLDLCCGDGSYSFLFFADISAHVDAIDYDSTALTYARRYYNYPNINFQRVNIIDEPFPAADYDIIVWNAVICYFTIEQIHSILHKIINAGKLGLVLCGMLPKANGHVDHKTEFDDLNALKTIFAFYFEEVCIKEVIEGNNFNIVNFYFTASKPKAYSALAIN